MAAYAQFLWKIMFIFWPLPTQTLFGTKGPVCSVAMHNNLCLIYLGVILLLVVLCDWMQRRRPRFDAVKTFSIGMGLTKSMMWQATLILVHRADINSGGAVFDGFFHGRDYVKRIMLSAVPLSIAAAYTGFLATYLVIALVYEVLGKLAWRKIKHA